MDIKLIPSKLNGCIEASSSKAYTQRLLIAASLCDKETVIHCNCLPEEIKVTASCLNVLGANITFEEGRITVKPIQELNDCVELDCGESDLTLRFLLPVAAALGLNAKFTALGRPVSRPIVPLRNEMQSYGVTFTPPWKYPIEISGKLQPGKFKLSGAMSAQYVTGLLLALPLLDGESQIDLSGIDGFRNYIDMTVCVMREFGISVEEKDESIIVKGNQKYVSPEEITAQGDWLSSAYLLTAGAFSDGVSIKGLDSDSFQNEKEILDILKRMGADVSIEQNKVTVKKGGLKGVQIDARALYDIIPALSVAAAYCESGITVFSNITQRRIKEKNATAVFSECLLNVGGVSAQTDDGLIVWSGENIVGGEVLSSDDYKIVMAMAVMVTNSNGEITVKNADCLNRANPEFLENYKKLGGKFDVINN